MHSHPLFLILSLSLFLLYLALSVFCSLIRSLFLSLYLFLSLSEFFFLFEYLFLYLSYLLLPIRFNSVFHSFYFSFVFVLFIIKIAQNSIKFPRKSKKNTFVSHFLYLFFCCVFASENELTRIDWL